MPLLFTVFILIAALCSAVRANAHAEKASEFDGSQSPTDSVSSDRFKDPDKLQARKYVKESLWT